MKWTFQYEGEWSAPSIKHYAKFLSIWRIGICEDGSFCISGSDPDLTMHRGTFATLAEAKAFCEMLERGYASEADLRDSNMNEPTHTPGPWLAFSDVVKNHTNILKIGKTTDLLFCLPGHDKHDPNVRLIVAAPELLEALEEAVNMFGFLWDDWAEMAKNAIAKAKGEQL